MSVTNEQIAAGLQIVVIAELARDFIWEPENWEAYQESKDSNSVAWPPEFLCLARAVETKYGAPPAEPEVERQLRSAWPSLAEKKGESK